jgi:hypothetical protein
VSAPNVRQAPAAYDIFYLDGDTSPGVSEVDNGGDAADDIQDQRQLLTKGAFTVDRGWVNASITYKLTLITDADLAKWAAWEKMFLEGRNRTPNVRNYLYQDLRGGWVKRVIFERMTMQKKEKPGGPWIRTLTLHEYRRPAPIGGPIKPADALDKVILGNEATLKDLNQQLAQAQAASRAAARLGK